LEHEGAKGHEGAPAAVIPVQTGIQPDGAWIPVCTGMTKVPQPGKHNA
jgi:hypothetical protein